MNQKTAKQKQRGLSGVSISVIIPTHNRADLLGRAIRSVCKQTFSAYQLIVVDDGSVDHTQQIVREFEAMQLTYVRHERSKGAAAARNSGIKVAAGQLLAFLDDDDEWLPEKLRKQVQALANAPTNVGAIYSGYRIIADATNTVVKTWIPGPDNLNSVDFLRSTSFMTSIPLIRRSCFDDVGLFDEDLPGSQDQDMWIRLARRFVFQSIPDIVANHCIHGDQITSNLSTKIVAKEHILRKYRDELADHPKILRHQLERLGLLHCANGSFEKGRQFISEALSLDPSRNSLRLHLLLSQADAEIHRQHVIANEFKTVDGISLFY